MHKCKPIATLMSTFSCLDKDELGKPVDVKLYRSMIGSLVYLFASRPEIMFSVCLCAKFQSILRNPTLRLLKESLGI